jgi:hypothetical protein
VDKTVEKIRKRLRAVRFIDRFDRWETFYRGKWTHCPGFLAKAYAASHGLTGEQLCKAHHLLRTKYAHYDNSTGLEPPMRLSHDLWAVYRALRYAAREAVVQAWLAHTFLPSGLSMEGIKALFYKSHKIDVPDSIFRRIKEVAS